MDCCLVYKAATWAYLCAHIARRPALASGRLVQVLFRVLSRQVVQVCFAPEYLDLYNAILAKLDPRRVVDELEAFGPTPTMLCFESAKGIEAGICYCHRHLAAQWLEDSLGIKVEEVGHPDLPRFRYLRGKHFVPSYVRREPVEQLCLFDV
jgi:hypothetical protein